MLCIINFSDQWCEVETFPSTRERQSNVETDGGDEDYRRHVHSEQGELDITF